MCSYQRGFTTPLLGLHQGEIDFGISPPPPLKAPVIPPPEKYECSLQKIEEGQTQSIEVADDKLGVIDIVESTCL